MRSGVFILFSLIPFTAFSMGIVPLESPLIETESTSPRFEAMGGISIGVDDPDGDFRFNPAKAAYLTESTFYAYPRLSIFTHKQKNFDTAEDYSFSSESNYLRTGASPELGAVIIYDSGFYYGFRTDYEFTYAYFIDKSISGSSTYFDRTKDLSHSIPVSFMLGKKLEEASLSIEVGAKYTSSIEEAVYGEPYGAPEQSQSGIDVSVRPGIVIFADKNTRFSIFFQTNVYSKNKLKVKEYSMDYRLTEEKYDIKNKEIQGEIDFIKDFEKISIGGLFGFFSDKVEVSPVSFTAKEGFRIGAGVSSKATPSTLIGSDIVYSMFDSDLPAGILPLSDFITFGKIEDNNIQWKAGVEQQFGDNYSVRFGYIMVWNIYNSHFDEEEISRGNKLLYNAITSGVSYEKGSMRFDYLLRFNNLFTALNSEIVNTFGFVIRI
jgi:hypothetical protein